MINSNQYWNDLFEKEDQTQKRTEQTNFFVNLAINNLPAWIIEDIRDNNLSICDVGCAEGTGTQILQESFQNSNVSGVDFSEKAIEIARKSHKNCRFNVADVKSMSQKYDVIFSSNVLEHFYDSSKVMRHLVSCAESYCILLLPFREYYTCPEHASYFDFQSFPLTINETYDLCYYKPITIPACNEKYWFGEQIIIVYGKKEYLKRQILTLRNLYNGYIEERTKIIQNYDRKIYTIEKEEQAILEKHKNLEEQLANEKNKSLQDHIKLEKEFANEKEKILKRFDEWKNREIIEKQQLLQAYREQIDHISQEKDHALQESLQKTKMIEHDIQACSSALESVNITQNSRVYKFSLVIRRFFVQFFKEKEQTDFIKWIFSKITKKNYNTRYLCEYDYLENTKHYLKSQKYDTCLENNYKNNINGTQKEMPTVIIFASVPFYDVGGGQRSAQIAKTFNSLGYQVHYIYGFECSEKDIPDMFIPTITHKIIDEINLDWFKHTLSHETLIIFEIPFKKFELYLHMAKKYGCYIIYEHIDNWDSSLGDLFYDENVFKNFVEQADLITVTAKLLGEKIRNISSRKYLYLPNAVNIELFEPLKTYTCPNDLVIAKKGGKTLLYFGSLWGEWFDWDKIIYISDKCKDCEINLIGDYSGIKERVISIEKNVEKNIHFLGLKNQSELPAYLQYSDIAILPFKNCDIGKYVSPLKIFEYVAMNKKVISTSLDDIQNYPNVYCSDRNEDWAEMIYYDEPLKNTNDFIYNNSWFSRCNELISHAFPNTNKNISISVIVLNYNNRKVIERCINTLLMYNNQYSYEIIVVDNGSTDGSFEFLYETYREKIILVKNDRNGCSSGRNLGVTFASGNYLCFLDSDQWVVSDHWLDNAIQILDKKKYIGAVSWNAGWFSPGSTMGPIVDYLPNRAMDNPAVWFRTDIAYLATSGLVIRKKLFEEIEGFDVFYDPTCYEDTDLSLKIRDWGFEIAYCPYMSIMHLPHQTTKSGSPQHSKLMEKNGNYFYEKWNRKNPKLLKYYL